MYVSVNHFVSHTRILTIFDQKQIKNIKYGYLLAFVRLTQF
jgi:hypothetical protein